MSIRSTQINRINLAKLLERERETDRPTTSQGQVDLHSSLFKQALSEIVQA
jgi:hypothetical protein